MVAASSDNAVGLNWGCEELSGKVDPKKKFLARPRLNTFCIDASIPPGGNSYAAALLNNSLPLEEPLKCSSSLLGHLSLVQVNPRQARQLTEWSSDCINDTKFTAQFDAAIESSGPRIKRNTLVSPNLRAHIDRFMPSLKQQCLYKFVFVAERHLNHINREWRLDYTGGRPHEARGHLTPAKGTPPRAIETVRLTDIVYSSQLDGLLKHYERRAA